MDKPDYPAIGGGMVVEHEHWAVANLLIGRYGRQAADQAAVRAEDADAKGDREGRDIWQSVEGVLSRHNIHAGQYD
jgi:hypothetical protein